jgi:GNAT superfamily N-acetyltransferase
MRMPMREAGAMTTSNRLFRRATLTDAAELAELVEFASEGLALYLWTQLAGRGGDPPLMNMAPDTWYVHALAAYPEHRGGGLGTALLAQAGKRAADASKPGLSLIVSETNAGARRLYERNGFREAGRRRMVKQEWRHPGTDWVLMTKWAADHAS